MADKTGRLEGLIAGQSEVLEMITDGRPLSSILEHIIQWAEVQSDEKLSAALLLTSSDNHLITAAAPGVPTDFSAAVEKARLWSQVINGRQAVIIDNLADSTAPADLKALAAVYGFTSCWTYPLITKEQRVAGIFAAYVKRPSQPSEENLQLIRLVSNTALLAIAFADNHANAEAAREKIRATEINNRLAIEAADLGTFDIDLQAGAMLWNARCREMFGIFTARPVSYEDDFIKGLHPDDIERVRNSISLTFDQARSNGEFDVEYRTVGHEDQIIRWVRAKGKAFFNELAQPVRFVGATLEITDQKQNEREQARLAAIITSSDDAIISKTLEGIITSWNTSAEKLFGYTAAEAVGQHISLIIPPDRLNEESIIIGKVSKAEKLEHFETYRRNKSGDLVPISLTVSPIKNKAGHVIGASKIVRDISAHKRSEVRLQKYAESLEVLNMVGKTILEDLDVQNILQKVTDATTSLTGAQFGAFFHNLVNEKGESYMLYTLSGAPREAFEKFGMPRNTKIFAPTFNGDGIVRVDDITKDTRYGHNSPNHGMPKGHLPVVSYLAVPVISKSGAVSGGLFFGHPEPGKFTADHERLIAGVAAQAAVALDNAKLYEEIKVLNSKKDEFIGLASHELKTPITSIKGYLQIIEKEIGPNERAYSFVKKARGQVNKLAGLIEDLLDVSKIQTGQLPFDLAVFDLGQLLKEACEMLQQTNPSHRLELALPATGLPVHADQQRIEQVIINLVSNGIKYSPGKNRIAIRAEIIGVDIRVSVQDFGIGIAADQHERIFSRFYRVENLASHMSGLGIGLYISHEIIVRHEGKMWLESEPEKGSTFHFSLPLHPQG